LRVGSREEKEASFGNRVTAGKEQGSPTASEWEPGAGGKAARGLCPAEKDRGSVLTAHVQGGNWKDCREGPSQLGIREDVKRRAGRWGNTHGKARPPEHNDGGSLVLARMAARRFCSTPYEQG